MICENCKKEHNGSFGSGRFCGRSCANKRTHSDETKSKIGKSCLGKKYPNRKGKSWSNGVKFDRKIYTIQCKLCGNYFEKDICIKMYKSGLYLPICDSCRLIRKDEWLNNTSEVPYILRLYKIFLKRRKSILNKMKDISWEEAPKPEKYRRVFKEQENKCDICNIENWMNKDITFHMHHKDGNSGNNNRENLQYLCPNCHSQTDTYCANNNSQLKGFFENEITEFEFKEALLKSKNISQALDFLKLPPKQKYFKKARKILDNINNFITE
jgi:hypothetical protein